MMSYISMPAVLEKIMQDPTYKSGKFGEIKELILGMLETYNYELTLLETTKKILGRDLHGQYKRQKDFLTRGFQPASTKCGLCGRLTSSRESVTTAFSSQSEIVLFRCGHIYHRSCLEGSIGFEEEPVCVLCNKSNAIRTFGYRRSNSRSEKRDNRPASAKKKGAGKRVDVQGNLSQEQQTALDNLWSYGHNTFKPGEFLQGQFHRSRVLSSRTSSVVEPVDSKFALRLDPPPLINNVN